MYLNRGLTMSDSTAILESVLKSNERLADEMTSLNNNLHGLSVHIAELSKSVEHQSDKQQEVKEDIGLFKQTTNDSIKKLTDECQSLQTRTHTLELHHANSVQRAAWWSNNWHKILQTTIVVCGAIGILYGAYLK